MAAYARGSADVARAAHGQLLSGGAPRGGKMNSLERLETYLASIRRRLRTLILTRAAAVTLTSILVITAGAAWWLSRNDFARSGVVTARVLLALLLCVTLAAAFYWPRRLALNDGSQ